jgi:murein DD-endopeptidase MepM/ murein hydrolase activator NlpD
VSTATHRLSWKRRAFSTGAGIALLLSAIAGPSWSASAQDFDISVDSIAELSGLTAIAGGDGDGVNVRDEPGIDSDIVTTVPDGTVVDLRVDVLDTVRKDDLRWWPVHVDGVDGWIAGPWLQDSDGAPSSSDGSDSPSDSSTAFESGSYVRAVTDDGTSVNVRNEPSLDGDVLTGILDGDIAQVMDGPFTDDDGGDWYKVTDGDVTGYASAEWLQIATGPDADGVVADFAIDDWVRVSTDDRSGLNLRRDATRSSEVVDGLGENARLLILDGPVLDDDGQPWYEVNHFNQLGWVDGTYLESSSEPSYSSSYSEVAGDEAPADDSGDTSDTEAPAQVAAEPGVATGVLRAPLDSYTVTQEFGCSYLGFYTYNDAYGCPVHDGIDLAAPMYTPIYAADGGTVSASGWCDCGLGYYVQIDHGNGLSTIYGHQVEQPPVSVGQQVAKGELIGHVGSTGASTGPHTHFMVLQDGTAQNPRNYVSFP